MEGQHIQSNIFNAKSSRQHSTEANSPEKDLLQFQTQIWELQKTLAAEIGRREALEKENKAQNGGFSK